MRSWIVGELTAISNSLSTKATAKQTINYILSRWSITNTTFIKFFLWITTHLGMHTRPEEYGCKTKGTFKLMKQNTLHLGV